MTINLNKPDRWKADIKASVDLYNTWFMNFAPQTFRDERIKASKSVEEALKSTDNLRNITPTLLERDPGVLPMLRMATCPPIARDRLVGLAGVSKNLVTCMEGKPAKDGKEVKKPMMPPKMPKKRLIDELTRIGDIITRLADRDIFVWLESGGTPAEADLHRAATIVADRLCGAQADPIIRNEQERRQLEEISKWLSARGYKEVKSKGFDEMTPGTYAFRVNVPVALATEEADALEADAEETEEDRTDANGGLLPLAPDVAVEDDVATVNITVDVVIMPRSAKVGDFPLLIEAKSAGDFTNVNKRRKEEAQKIRQLKRHYHDRNVRFGLFLCGYFDSGYLGYAAADGIDWVWEHRINDMAGYGL